MVHLGFLTFVIMFTLLEARDSTFNHHNYQGKFDDNVAPRRLDPVVGSSKPTILEETTLGAKAEMKDTKQKGRKFAKEGGNNANEEHHPWKCNRRGRLGRINHVLSCKQREQAKMGDIDGFVALSADYHYPTPHPPKHN